MNNQTQKNLMQKHGFLQEYENPTYIASSAIAEGDKVKWSQTKNQLKRTHVTKCNPDDPDAIGTALNNALPHDGVFILENQN